MSQAFQNIGHLFGEFRNFSFKERPGFPSHDFPLFLRLPKELYFVIHVKGNDGCTFKLGFNQIVYVSIPCKVTSSTFDNDTSIPPFVPPHGQAYWLLYRREHPDSDSSAIFTFEITAVSVEESMFVVKICDIVY